MARLVMCGWESGTPNEFGSLISLENLPGIATNIFRVETPGRSGNYALEIGTRGSNFTSCYCYCSAPLPGNPSEIWLRIAVGNLTTPAGGDSTNDIVNSILDLMNGATRQLGLALSAVGNVLLYRGTTQIAAGGTIPTSGYVVIELHAVIHNSSGVATLWVNGVQVINFSGDTQEAASTQITDVTVGVKRITNDTGGSPQTPWEHHLSYDDLAINDTTGSVNNGRIGQGGIVVLCPSADTAEKAWTRSAGSDNFALVDDVPCDGDTTYISAVDSGALDLYEHGNLVLGGTIDAVQVVLATRIASGSGRFVAPTLRSGAATSVGSTFSATNTYGFGAQIWGTDPNTAVPWSVAAVNSLQAGVTLTN